MPSRDKGGKNITGVSDAVDIESQINAFRSIVPFTRLGMIYTSSEDNSVVMHKVTKEVCDTQIYGQGLKGYLMAIDYIFSVFSNKC